MESDGPDVEVRESGERCKRRCNGGAGLCPGVGPTIVCECMSGPFPVGFVCKQRSGEGGWVRLAFTYQPPFLKCAVKCNKATWCVRERACFRAVWLFSLDHTETLVKQDSLFGW